MNGCVLSERHGVITSRIMFLERARTLIHECVWKGAGVLSSQTFKQTFQVEF